MNVKYNSGIITTTRTQLAKWKEEIYEKAIEELQNREQDIINSVSDDSLLTVLLTGIKALIEMDCEYEFVEEFADRVADIIQSLNEDGMTLDDLEREVSEFGLNLTKAQSSYVPKELLKGD